MGKRDELLTRYFNFDFSKIVIIVRILMKVIVHVSSRWRLTVILQSRNSNERLQNQDEMENGKFPGQSNLCRIHICTWIRKKKKTIRHWNLSNTNKRDAKLAEKWSRLCWRGTWNDALRNKWGTRMFGREIVTLRN